MEFEPRGVQGWASIVREGTAHGRTVAPHDFGFRVTPSFEAPFDGAYPTDTLFQFFLGMAVGFIDGLRCLAELLQGVDRLLIDATERAYHRSTDDAKQRSITVGKKQHTLKNTVMSLPDKLIVFLGRTFSGHNHDYRMLKQELPPELDWFTDINVRVDLGYLGMQSDYRGDRIDIPTKKPRKSKKNPNPQLSDEQKAANTALSQVRIFIEHAIGGMKRYNILVHVFRNRKADFEDDAVG